MCGILENCHCNFLILAPKASGSRRISNNDCPSDNAKTSCPTSSWKVGRSKLFVSSYPKDCRSPEEFRGTFRGIPELSPARG